MKDNFAFLEALNQIARDKGISTEILLDALANALVAAYKRLPTAAEEAVVTSIPRPATSGCTARSWTRTATWSASGTTRPTTSAGSPPRPPSRSSSSASARPSATRSTRSTPAARATSSPA